MRFGIWLVALLAIVLGGYWYAAGHETVTPEGAREVSEVRLRVREPYVKVEEPVAARRVTFNGLQTTVPDTLGYDRSTATRALEDGSFRVRVMYHDVSSLRDEGVVLQQLPRGGVTRRVGWTVTIVVGRLS